MAYRDVCLLENDGSLWRLATLRPNQTAELVARPLQNVICDQMGTVDTVERVADTKTSGKSDIDVTTFFNRTDDDLHALVAGTRPVVVIPDHQMNQLISKR